MLNFEEKLNFYLFLTVLNATTLSDRIFIRYKLVGKNNLRLNPLKLAKDWQKYFLVLMSKKEATIMQIWSEQGYMTGLLSTNDLDYPTQGNDKTETLK